jgi:hypothetical protein
MYSSILSRIHQTSPFVRNLVVLINQRMVAVCTVYADTSRRLPLPQNHQALNERQSLRRDSNLPGVHPLAISSIHRCGMGKSNTMIFLERAGYAFAATTYNRAWSSFCQ